MQSEAKPSISNIQIRLQFTNVNLVFVLLCNKPTLVPYYFLCNSRYIDICRVNTGFEYHILGDEEGPNHSHTHRSSCLVREDMSQGFPNPSQTTKMQHIRSSYYLFQSFPVLTLSLKSKSVKGN